MWESGGYRGNWLFILTSKLIWLEFWAIKITAVGAVGFSSWWFFKTVKDSIARSEANQKEQLRIAEHNKKAAAYNALHEGYRKTAEENQIREEVLRKEEFKKQQELLKIERTGPRKEADALKKALEGINYGGSR